MKHLPIRRSFILALILLNGLFAVWYWGIKPSQIKPLTASALNKVGVQKSARRVPNFLLIDSSGKEITRKKFDGKVWLASFIYTNCPDQCPMISTKLSLLQSALPESVQFASFTVDPERDSPQALSRYASNFRADPNRWSFLTGSKQELNKILSAFGAPGLSSPDAHSVRLYLVDQKSQIRGMYDTMGEGVVKNLTASVNQLLLEAKA